MNLKAQRDALQIALAAIERRRDGLEVVREIDPLDNALASSERERAALVADKDTAKARAIVDALERLTDGSYGECLDCGEPIAERRLEAIPWAAKCRACAEGDERRAREDAA